MPTASRIRLPPAEDGGGGGGISSSSGVGTGRVGGGSVPSTTAAAAGTLTVGPSSPSASLTTTAARKAVRVRVGRRRDGPTLVGGDPRHTGCHAGDHGANRQIQQQQQQQNKSEKETDRRRRVANNDDSNNKKTNKKKRAARRVTASPVPPGTALALGGFRSLAAADVSSSPSDDEAESSPRQDSRFTSSGKPAGRSDPAGTGGTGKVSAAASSAAAGRKSSGGGGDDGGGYIEEISSDDDEKAEREREDDEVQHALLASYTVPTGSRSRSRSESEERPSAGGRSSASTSMASNRTPGATDERRVGGTASAARAAAHKKKRIVFEDKIAPSTDGGNVSTLTPCGSVAPQRSNAASAAAASSSSFVAMSKKSKKRRRKSALLDLVGAGCSSSSSSDEEDDGGGGGEADDDGDGDDEGMQQALLESCGRATGSNWMNNRGTKTPAARKRRAAGDVRRKKKASASSAGSSKETSPLDPDSLRETLLGLDSSSDDDGNGGGGDDDEELQRALFESCSEKKPEAKSKSNQRRKTTTATATATATRARVGSVPADRTRLSDHDDDEDKSSDDNEEVSAINAGSGSRKRGKQPARMEQRKRPNPPPSSSSGGRGGGGGGGGGGWLTSLNSTPANRRTNDGKPSDESESSSDEDDDRLSSIRRRNWAESSNFPQRLESIEALDNDNDKALQMLLWDNGFRYTLLSHQFEAVRAVAGVSKTFPGGGGGSDGGAELALAMLEPDAGRNVRYGTLSAALSSRSGRQQTTRGLLLADEMGLGKTVESVAGAFLRIVISKVSDKRQLPTLIISPGDGIQDQWYETLVKAGVEKARIMVFGDGGREKKKKKTKNEKGGRKGNAASRLKGASYVLCTRYKIQAELKHLFDCTTLTTLKAKHEKSMFFPNVSVALIRKLRNQYRAANGLDRNDFIRRKETKEDCVARLVRESFGTSSRGSRGGSGAPFRASFQTVIIDEAHFVKNVLAYWGIGSALLGAQCKRMVLLTGTPYNNGPQDMSALMAYIDPAHEASSKDWWIKATAGGTARSVVTAVRAWRDHYMLRRTKDVLAAKLKPRTITTIHVGAFPSELAIYEAYEDSFIKVLEQFQEDQQDGSPDARRRMKELFNIMMATMACMRMSLIHPMLPGGRELTIQFSPSRRHLLKREERPKDCVICSRISPTEASEKFAAKKASKERGDDGDGDKRPLLGSDVRVRSDMDLDDEELDDEDNLGLAGMSDAAKGPLVVIEADICCCHGSDCRHFAHERCLEVLREGSGGAQCPRCSDLRNRIHITNVKSEEHKVPHGVYCKNVITSTKAPKGFTATAKMERVIEWFQTSVPADEKVIFLSFFKGSLDLLEGVLVEDLKVGCARYDGDLDKAVRSRELDRFKASPTCRVLLATVQSGGTGLNITEANNVCFLDRWFNPCVHDQAESRCHRIGQKREVQVAYMDTGMTVDDVMAAINVIKAGNASVLLADGTALGANQSALGYNELSGLIGRALKSVRSQRYQCLVESSQSTTVPLPPADRSKLEEIKETKPPKTKRSKVKAEADQPVANQERPSSSSSMSSDDAMLDETVFSSGPGGNKDGAMENEQGKRSSSSSSSSTDDEALGKAVFSSRVSLSRVADRSMPGNRSDEIIEILSDDDDSLPGPAFPTANIKTSSPLRETKLDSMDSAKSTDKDDGVVPIDSGNERNGPIKLGTFSAVNLDSMDADDDELPEAAFPAARQGSYESNEKSCDSNDSTASNRGYPKDDEEENGDDIVVPESSLIEAIKGGDRSAAEELFHKWYESQQH